MAKGRVRMVGEMAILAAIFDQAWRDTRVYDRWLSAEAWEFLRDEETIRALEDLGVDGGYYRMLLDAPERDRIEDGRQAVQYMYHVEEMGVTLIGEELFGYKGLDSVRLKRLKEIAEVDG